MKNRIHYYFSKPPACGFFSPSALLADSLAEVQRISTSTLARSSEMLQKNKATEEGEWRERRDVDLEAIKAGSWRG